MSWIQEWHAHLSEESERTQHTYPADFRTDVYNVLRLYCKMIGVVYFPPMYNEYITWNSHYGHLYRTMNEPPTPLPTDTHLQYFSIQSVLIQEQLRKREFIRGVEQYAIGEHLQFHDNNIMEKIAFVISYRNMRNHKI